MTSRSVLEALIMSGVYCSAASVVASIAVTAVAVTIIAVMIIATTHPGEAFASHDQLNHEVREYGSHPSGLLSGELRSDCTSRAQQVQVTFAGKPHMRLQDKNTNSQKTVTEVSSKGLPETLQASLPGTMDEFLASVEKRAFVMARYSTRDDDAALDAVQDSMMHMVRKYARKPPEEWAPLFFRILSNRLGDHHRKRGFARLFQWRGTGDDEENADPVDQLAHEGASPDIEMEAGQINAALRLALAALPERQRQVFVLRQWQGMSVDETAAALGVSGGSVKTHLSRAMQSLREHLREYAPNEIG